MVDMYCNCHNMIGNMGWMSISGDILKLASCGLLILNTDKMQVLSFNPLAQNYKTLFFFFRDGKTFLTIPCTIYAAELLLALLA